MKRRNPGWGCPRSADLVGVEIDKEVVRRVAERSLPAGLGFGRSFWLTFFGHTKDSLWSCDLFRCESNTANPLGSCCDGPVYTSHHWFWRPQRHR